MLWLGKKKAGPTDDILKLLWNICAVEYYTVVKKVILCPFKTKWVGLQVTMLSEIIKEVKNNF